jgi:hypothetical protein
LIFASAIHLIKKFNQMLVLFDKIFGNKKETRDDFISTSKLLPEDSFWSVIQLTFEKANGDFDEQQEVLTGLLKKMKPEEIMMFDNRFRQLHAQAYDWDLWGAIYIINGGCSDDSFIDFRGWLIAQGKEFYYKSISDPESLVYEPEERIDVEWEGINYIPRQVFEEITGKEMPRIIKEDSVIKGQEWKEDNDDLEKRFPKLWSKYC